MQQTSLLLILLVLLFNQPIFRK